MADSTADERDRARKLLNDAWLVINDPTNSFVSAEVLSRLIEQELGEIKGCMRLARGVKVSARSGLADAFGREVSR